MSYNFNRRNWITGCDNNNQIFGYTLDYLANGNISDQYLPGSYRFKFNDIKEVKSN